MILLRINRNFPMTSNAFLFTSLKTLCHVLMHQRTLKKRGHFSSLQEKKKIPYRFITLKNQIILYHYR